MLVKNNKVLINYKQLKNNIDKQIKNNTMLTEIMNNEIKEMWEYDLKHGIERTICKIYYRDILGEKVKRFELDSKFCYYEDELVKININNKK